MLSVAQSLNPPSWEEKIFHIKSGWIAGHSCSPSNLGLVRGMPLPPCCPCGVPCPLRPCKGERRAAETAAADRKTGSRRRPCAVLLLLSPLPSHPPPFCPCRHALIQPASSCPPRPRPVRHALVPSSGVITVHRKSGTLSQLDAQHSDTQGGSPWVNRWRGVRIRSQNRPKSSPTSRFLPFLWGNKIGQKGPGLRLLPDTEHRGN